MNGCDVWEFYYFQLLSTASIARMTAGPQLLGVCLRGTWGRWFLHLAEISPVLDWMRAALGNCLLGFNEGSALVHRMSESTGGGVCISNMSVFIGFISSYDTLHRHRKEVKKKEYLFERPIVCHMDTLRPFSRWLVKVTGHKLVHNLPRLGTPLWLYNILPATKSIYYNYLHK